MIRLRRLDHACLRVADLDEATARWAIQFGLTPAFARDGRAYLRCGYEEYCLELVAGEPGHDHTGYELHRDCSLDAAAAHLDACGVTFERREGALHLADPDGCGLELRAYREPENRFPDVGRLTTVLPAGRPRKLGHTNVMTSRYREMIAFYTDVLGMRVSDRLGEHGSWYAINSDHHVMAIVNRGPSHIHHIAFDVVDFGQMRALLDHICQHGRWLGWGPVRHGMAQNLAAYVRIPDEHLFVELYCDMEQLQDDHVPRDWPDDPRGSNLWGVLPPRSFFRFDAAAVESERLQLEAQGTPLPPM